MMLVFEYPGSASIDDLKFTITGISIYTVTYLLYSIFTKFPYLTLVFLAFPTFLWGFQWIVYLTNPIDKEGTIVSTAGFIACLIILSYSIYRNIRKTNVQNK